MRPANGHPIQIILTRQLATHLNVAVFLVDPKGTLLFYNEPAEAILGGASTIPARCRLRTGRQRSFPWMIAANTFLRSNCR